MNSYKKELIDKALEKAISNKELAGASVLILDNGTESYYTEMGLANIETKDAIKRDTIYRLYSMTKPVTAVATMILMERGLIDLFDSVSSFLPGFKNQKVVESGNLSAVKRDMNIKDLLNMTSGLLYPGMNVAGKGTDDVFKELDQRLLSETPMSTLEFANKMGNVPLDFQPGDSWNYGSSADILGAIIEVVAGKSFGEFLKEEIFEPLNMIDTDFFVPEYKQNRFAKTYETTENKELILYDGNNLGIINAMDRKPAFESGGAGLASTIDDYAKFATMLIQGGTYNGNTILSKGTVNFLTTQVLDDMQSVNFRNWHTFAGFSYGNLMRICNKPELGGGLLSFGEYGWDGWLGCYFANLPKEEKTILVMMQKKDAGTTSLTRKLRNIILS